MGHMMNRSESDRKAYERTASRIEETRELDRHYPGETRTRQHVSSLARQVYGLEMAMEAAWYWFGDVGPRETPHKLYSETEDFGL